LFLGHPKRRCMRSLFQLRHFEPHRTGLQPPRSQHLESTPNTAPNNQDFREPKLFLDAVHCIPEALLEAFTEPSYVSRHVVLCTNLRYIINEISALTRQKRLFQAQVLSLRPNFPLGRGAADDRDGEIARPTTDRGPRQRNRQRQRKRPRGFGIECEAGACNDRPPPLKSAGRCRVTRSPPWPHHQIDALNAFLN